MSEFYSTVIQMEMALHSARSAIDGVHELAMSNPVVAAKYQNDMLDLWDRIGLLIRQTAEKAA